MCYGDRTYCVSPNCKCDRKLTEQIRAEARRLELPLSIGHFCGGLFDSKYELEEKSSKDNS
jgi:hypothetical protein